MTYESALRHCDTATLRHCGDVAGLRVCGSAGLRVCLLGRERRTPEGIDDAMDG